MKRTAPLAALCGLALLGACSSSGVRNGPLSGESATVGDADVDDLVELQNERVAFGDNELAVYQVEILNRGREAVRVEYRARWFDDDGIEIGDVTRSWRPVFVPAGSSYPVRSVARNMQAVRCLVEERLHDSDSY